MNHSYGSIPSAAYEVKSELKTRTLQSLADARDAQELRPNPEYQRGPKCSLPQKQGLIDSLLRGYQIPLFCVHVEERKNNYTGGVEKTAWLVDGQSDWTRLSLTGKTSSPCRTLRESASRHVFAGLFFRSASFGWQEI